MKIHEAKTHLSRLLGQVAAGERVVISKAGSPVADLVPHQVRRACGRIGAPPVSFRPGNEQHQRGTDAAAGTGAAAAGTGARPQRPGAR